MLDAILEGLIGGLVGSALSRRIQRRRADKRQVAAARLLTSMPMTIAVFNHTGRRLELAVLDKNVPCC